jgi:hypothetical protein
MMPSKSKMIARSKLGVLLQGSGSGPEVRRVDAKREGT